MFVYNDNKLRIEVPKNPAEAVHCICAVIAERNKCSEYKLVASDAAACSFFENQPRGIYLAVPSAANEWGFSFTLLTLPELQYEIWNLGHWVESRLDSAPKFDIKPVVFEMLMAAGGERLKEISVANYLPKNVKNENTRATRE